MAGLVSSEAELIEREIREKIDAIFEQDIAEQRFFRESSGEVKAGSARSALEELLAELKSFYDLVTEERSTLKALLHLLPNPGEVHDLSPDEARRDLLELAEDIRRVGKNVGPILDRLLRLTEQILQTTSQS